MEKPDGSLSHPWGPDLSRPTARLRTLLSQRDMTIRLLREGRSDGTALDRIDDSITHELRWIDTMIERLDHLTEKKP